MFKKICILAIFVLAFEIVFSIATKECRAGTFEVQSKQVGANEVWKYTSTVGFGEKITPHFGWTGFVLSSNTWGEAYVGPTYSPAPWVTVAICAGIQDNPQVSRFAAWYSLSHGQWSLFHVMEDGAGRWHKLLASYDFGRGKVQYWDQAGLGRGPRVEVKVPSKKARITLYSAILWDGDNTNNAFGLIKTF